MEEKRRLTITRPPDCDLTPAQLLLRNSKFVKEAQEEKRQKDMEAKAEAARMLEAETNRSDDASAPPTVAGRVDMGTVTANLEEQLIDTLIALSSNAHQLKGWAMDWATKSTQLYLYLLLKQELGNLTKDDGKLDITALATKLNMRYQSLYQLMYRGGSPRLETLAGIAAMVGYAVEPRFIPIEEAVEHEVFKSRLTLEGRVDNTEDTSAEMVKSAKAVFAETREYEREVREERLKQRQEAYRKSQEEEEETDTVKPANSLLPLGDQLSYCMSLLKELNGITNYQIAIKSNTCKATVGRVAKGEMSVSLAAIGKVMSAFPRYTLQLSVVEVDGAQDIDEDDDETDSIYKVLADTDVDPDDENSTEEVDENTDEEVVVTYEKRTRY